MAKVKMERRGPRSFGGATSDTYVWQVELSCPMAAPRIILPTKKIDLRVSTESGISDMYMTVTPDSRLVHHRWNTFPNGQRVHTNSSNEATGAESPATAKAVLEGAVEHSTDDDAKLDEGVPQRLPERWDDERVVGEVRAVFEPMRR